MKYVNTLFVERDVATAKLAHDVRRDSNKPSPASSVSTSEIYSWASQLASESRKLNWVFYWYVWPDAVREIIHKLEGMNGGIVGLVGFQGVGKSSALLAIEAGRMLLQDEGYRRTHKSGHAPDLGRDVIRFKWRRQSELFQSLLNGTHGASAEFQSLYLRALVARLKWHFPLMISGELEKNPERLNQDWAAKMLGKSAIRTMQQDSWSNILRKKKVILIDTPDYSKTDRRLMAKDLEEIYWLWNSISQATRFEDESNPNIVVAIQKEMFRDHFFFDKMEKVELEPLKPQQMVEAYRKRFKVIDPFTEDSLLNLARMSRGIFRRFLRYITLTLRRWEICGKRTIDTAIVKEAIPVARLAEDMELELAELFPKHSDLRLLAVRLLMLLEESGERKQIELADFLEVKPYELSRLLTRLEAAHYVARRRDGNDKIVSFFTLQNRTGKTIAAV